MGDQNSNLPMDVNDTAINVTKIDGEDYICLTDMAKSAGNERAITSWLRTKNTVDFLGFWEQLHNPDFKVHEFVYFKNNAGANSFNPSAAEWIQATGAKGIISKRGRYGGTYAHKDIAFEFGTWLSPQFKLLIITEFQRLKEKEQVLIEWDSKRYLSKINYKLHTDAIKVHIIPGLAKSAIHKYTYTDEADVLNRLVFGQIAADWKRANPKQAKGQRNQRDYATTHQLVILANLESLNSHLIANSKSQYERVDVLAAEALRQYSSLVDSEGKIALEEQKLLSSRESNDKVSS
jgi:hypothetical protein